MQYLVDGSVATEDEPPVVLGQLPAAFVTQMAKHLRPGRLLRFSIGEVRVQDLMEGGGGWGGSERPWPHGGWRGVGGE